MNLPSGSASNGFRVGIGSLSIIGATILLAEAFNLITLPTYILSPDGAASVVSFVGRFIVPSSNILTIAATLAFPGIVMAAGGALILASNRKKTKKLGYSVVLLIALGFMAFAFTAPAFSATYVTQTHEVNQYAGHSYSYLVQVVKGTTTGCNPTCYIAQNGTTSAVDYGGPTNAGGASGTSSYSVLSKTDTGNNLLISLSSGDFVLSQTLVQSGNNVTFSGSGFQTNLKGNFNMTGNFDKLESLTVVGQVNVYNDRQNVLRDVQITNTGKTALEFSNNIAETYSYNLQITGNLTLDATKNPASENYFYGVQIINGQLIMKSTTNGVSANQFYGVLFNDGSLTAGHTVISMTGSNCIANLIYAHYDGAAGPKLYSIASGSNENRLYLDSNQALSATDSDGGNIIYVNGANKNVKLTSYTPSAPTGTTSTAAFVMMGLAMSFTPRFTGTVFAICSMTATSNTGGDGVAAQISYSTTSSSNGAAAQGTIIAREIDSYSATGGKGNALTLSGSATGLTLTTAYTFDIQLEALTGGTASIAGITCTVQELN